MKRLKNTKIRSIIVLVILFVLLICIVWAGLFVYKNRNSIMAIYYASTNRVDVLEQNRQNTEERALQAMKEFGIETVRPLTDEETEKLHSGEISQEEAVNLILGRNNVEESDSMEDNTTSFESPGNTVTENNSANTGDNSTNTGNGNKNNGNNSTNTGNADKNNSTGNTNTGNTNKNNGNSSTNTGNANKNNSNTVTNTNSNSTTDKNNGTANKNNGNTNTNTNNSVVQEKNEEIAQLIGEMYVLKAKFSSDLKGIEDWVNSKYREYTKEFGEGNIPYSVKTKVGKKAYNDALALEADCDAKVEKILSRITTLLKETGQSTGVVNEIKAAYEDEKMLAKSYYMDQVD